jgi:hypothetical protein
MKILMILLWVFLGISVFDAIMLGIVIKNANKKEKRG